MFEEDRYQVKRTREAPTRDGLVDAVDMLEQVPLQHMEETDDAGEMVEQYGAGKWGTAIFDDGSIATGFRIEAPDPFFLSEEMANRMHDSLRAALGSLPREVSVQFVWNTWDEDEEILQAYRQHPGSHPLTNYIRTTLVARERERLQKGELKSYRGYCFINTKAALRHEVTQIQENRLDTRYAGVAKSAKKGLGQEMIDSIKEMIAWISRSSELLRHDKDEMFEDVVKITIERNRAARSNFVNAMGGCPGISLTPLGANEYYRLLRRAWSPGQWKIDKLVDGKTLEDLYRPLSLSFPAYFMMEDTADHGWTWRTGKYWHRLLTMKVPPNRCDVGVMVHNMVRRKNSEIYNSQYQLTLVPVSSDKEKKNLSTKLKLFRKQRGMDSAKYAQNKVIEDDLVKQISDLQRSDANNVFQTTLLIHIWHEDEEILNTWESLLVQTFDETVGCRIGPEQHASLPYYLGFGTPGFTNCKDTKRAHTYTAIEAATHIPLLGQSSGFVAEKPEERRTTLLMETHRGCLYVQDDFARGRVSSFAGVGVGMSGSGKSFLYNRKIASTFSDRDEIVILDAAVGTPSYRSNAVILAGLGSYHETRLPTPGREYEDLCFNVTFTEQLGDGSYRKPNAEEVQRMVRCIDPMLRNQPTQPLGQIDQSLISTAIHYAFESCTDGKGRVYLSNVQQAMDKLGRMNNDAQSARYRELALLLSSTWCRPHGTYATFVDGETTPTKVGLTAYDLRGLLDNQQLSGVMIMIYLNHINQLVEANLLRPPEKRKRISVYIDEAWALLKDANSVTALSGLYRAGRARNISPHCLSQRMSDFKKILVMADQATGKTDLDPDSNDILGGCVWFNLFKHDSKDVQVTRDVLKLPENQAQALESLGGEGGKYREMIQYVRLTNGNAFTKLRVTPTPYELWAFTSDDTERGYKLKMETELRAEGGKSEDPARRRLRYMDELKEAGFVNTHELDEDQLTEMMVTWRALITTRKS